jgi:hypothetical protein
MACPGSVRMETGLPDRETAYAREGTVAHELAQLCIDSHVDAAHYIGKPGHVAAGSVFDTIIVDEEMADGVQAYLDYVFSPPFKGYEKSFETHVSLAHFGIEGMEGGTADALLYSAVHRHLVVADFKYGRGIAIEPKENPQAMSYALGAAERYHNRGVSLVTVAIIQPRAPHPRGPVREWTANVADLAEFATALVAAAKATQVPTAPLVPGEWCKFCKAAPVCPALREKALTEAMADFDEQSPPPEPTTLTPHQLAGVLAEVDFIEMWCRRVREFAHAEATEGRCPPGWKLVAKRANRKWREDDEAAAALIAIVAEEELYTRKLVSPAQVERFVPGRNKAERAKFLSPLVIKESTGTVLAPSDDPRAAVKADAAVEFA